VKPVTGKRGIAVVAGSVAQKPGYGGHTWVFLQYLLGLRRLGWDVVFIDRLEPEMCVDSAGRRCPVERSWNLRRLSEVMRHFGLGEAWSLLYDGGRRVFGVPRKRLLDRVGSASAVFNVMGFLTDEEILAAAQRRVFLDIDPGFPQMWHELGLADLFRGHDQFLTIAENIGCADCSIPTCDIEWIKTAQPIVLEHWPVCASGQGGFASVASWRGLNAPVVYETERYGLRVHEFRKFAALPRESGRRFELALDIHAADRSDRQLLKEHGWFLVDPQLVAGNPWSYRRYVQQSSAEFSVAKGMYVKTRSGWFSDRSICYLASGKPVLAQDTGLRHLEPGEGLLAFGTIEDAVAGAEEICRDYSRHARAARDLAENCFDSDRVLSEVLAKLGIA
jgi:hypothetical protein